MKKISKEVRELQRIYNQKEDLEDDEDEVINPDDVASDYDTQPDFDTKEP